MQRLIFYNVLKILLHYPLTSTKHRGWNHDFLKYFAPSCIVITIETWAPIDDCLSSEKMQYRSRESNYSPESYVFIEYTRTYVSQSNKLSRSCASESWKVSGKTLKFEVKILNVQRLLNMFIRLIDLTNTRVRNYLSGLPATVVIFCVLFVH